MRSECWDEILPEKYIAQCLHTRGAHETGAALGVVILSFWAQIKQYPLFQVLPHSSCQRNSSSLSWPSTCTSVLGCPVGSCGWLGFCVQSRLWAPWQHGLYPVHLYSLPGAQANILTRVRHSGYGWMDGWMEREERKVKEKRGGEKRMEGLRVEKWWVTDEWRENGWMIRWVGGWDRGMERKKRNGRGGRMDDKMDRWWMENGWKTDE